MDMLILKSRIPRKIFFFTLILLLSVIGVIRYAVDIFNLSAVANDKPFSIPLPFSITILVLVIIVGFLFFSGLIKKFSFSTAFIIAGAFGNFVERLVVGSVKDYINIFVGWVNLSDLILWIGLIILNYEFWFKTIDTSDQILEDQPANQTQEVEPEMELKSQLKTKMENIRNDLDEINSTGNITLPPQPKVEAKITYVDHKAKEEQKKRLSVSLEKESYLNEQKKFEKDLITDNFNKLAQEPDVEDPEQHMAELKDGLNDLRSKPQNIQSIKISKDDITKPKIRIKIN